LKPPPPARTPELILASTSRYRHELLTRLRVPFATAAPEVDETPANGEAPRDLALRLARAKASAVRRAFPSALIIGCDQVAAIGGALLNKPGSHDHAVRQLRLMRGKPVPFFTALCVLDAASGRCQADVVTVIVHMREMADAQIERYLRAEQPYDCAGSARIEGLGIALVEKVESDDPTALIGLPLIRLCAMLRQEGIEVP
jgi:septum formation protein